MSNIVEISKWGNSLALRIPQKIARELGIKEKSKVNLSVTSGKMIVARSYSLTELCSQITDENKPVLEDMGVPVGREVVGYDEKEAKKLNRKKINDRQG
jgi:antitoxin MazE